VGDGTLVALNDHLAEENGQTKNGDGITPIARVRGYSVWKM
jgi:hypothetical protein